MEIETDNSEPISAQLRGSYEYLSIAVDEREMDSSRPVSPMEGENEMETSPQKQQRKEKQIRSAYQVEAEEEEDCLSMADPFKGKGYLRLDIPNFAEFCIGKPARLSSKTVWVRGLPWKILAMPAVFERRWGMGSYLNALSLFMQCEHEGGGWSCVASVEFHVISKIPDEPPFIRRLSHVFDKEQNDYGYKRFMTYDELNEEGLIDDSDCVSIAAYVSADAPQGVNWDSRRHAGFVGLRNQGATCYMNSLLQSLFFTNSLRKAVYEMTIAPDEDPDSSIALALQRVFYDLSHSDKPVGTTKLTKSFGWNRHESFVQHDVQELCRVLLDNLEMKMKGTKMQDMIPTLFKGKMSSYMKCTEVEFESAREEIFYDVQLNIRSKDPSRHNSSFNILDSFRDYVEAERMDGANKYDAGQFGLQPALKGVRFDDFPGIFQMHLMRFQFDYDIGANVKLNDRFEFADMLDLNEFVEKNEEGIDYTYFLHSVLVHSGDDGAGHYIVYINTDVKGRTAQWCKFDDEVVSRCSFKEAVVGNFGGIDNEVLGQIFSSAYMLVYIRKDKIDEVLCEVTDRDIPAEIIERFETEKELEEKREKEELHAKYNQNLYFLTDEILSGHSGFDLFKRTELVTPEIRHSILKAAPLENLFSYVKKNFLNGDNRYFRLWKFNCDRLINERGQMKSLSRFRATEEIELKNDNWTNKIVDELACEHAIIYIEKPWEQEEQEENNETDILIFLKYYDPDTKEARFVCTTTVDSRSSFVELQSDILAREGLPDDCKLRFYEEFSPDIIRYIRDLKKTFEEVLTEVENGVVIIFERIEFVSMTNNAMTLLREMYETIEVEFVENDDQSIFPSAVIDSPTVTMRDEVNLFWKCDQLTEYIANKLHCDPSRLLLWKTSKTQSMQPVLLSENKLRVRDLLSPKDRAIHDPRRQNKYTIAFNKISFPVVELDRRERRHVTMVDEKFGSEVASVYPDLNGTVTSILEEAARVFPFSKNGTGKLRLTLVWKKRVMKVFDESDIISCDISLDDLHLRVEEIPEDQMKKENNEHFLSVAHFDSNPKRGMFGVPLLIKVTEGESYDDVRERLRIRLGLREREMEKYTLSILSNDDIMNYLDKENDDRVKIDDLRESAETNGFGDVDIIWLGLDHVNRQPIRAEKGITIRN